MASGGDELNIINENKLWGQYPPMEQNMKKSQLPVID